MQNMMRKRHNTLAVALIGAAVSAAAAACATTPDDVPAGVGDPADSIAPEVAAGRAELAADNAAILANPVGGGSHCAIVLDKIQPGQIQSRVVSYTCAETRDALASMTAAAESSVLLMEWWVDLNYGGPGTAILGNGGPCDSAGYGIVDTGFGWHNIISSLKSFSNCDYVVAYTGTNFGGISKHWWDPNGIDRIPAVAVSYVGDSFNDAINSFRVLRL